METDIENKLDALGELHDAWKLLQNTREFTADINLTLIDAAQADIDKVIIALTQELVYLRRGLNVDAG